MMTEQEAAMQEKILREEAVMLAAMAGASNKAISSGIPEEVQGERNALLDPRTRSKFETKESVRQLIMRRTSAPGDTLIGGFKQDDNSLMGCNTMPVPREFNEAMGQQPSIPQQPVQTEMNLEHLQAPQRARVQAPVVDTDPNQLLIEFSPLQLKDLYDQLETVRSKMVKIEKQLEKILQIIDK